MKLKKFISVAALSVLAISITACTKKPDSSFQKNLDLGYYQGMHVTWVKDDADTVGTGFYVIDDTNIDKSKSNNSDFEQEKFVGNYGDLKILWVRDHTDANSKGFYLFKNKDEQIISSITLGEKFQSGKSTTTKNVGTVFTSAINKPTLKVNLDNPPSSETINVNELSSAQLIKLSQHILQLAEQKQLDNTSTVNNTKKRLF